MNVGIVGSRKYKHLELVVDFVWHMQMSTEVVSGGAVGVDTVAAIDAARGREMDTHIFWADWERDGRRAGMIRNSILVDYVDYVVAFWDGSSTGTAYTIQKAKHAGKLFRVYGPDGEVMDMGGAR